MSSSALRFVCLTFTAASLALGLGRAAGQHNPSDLSPVDLVNLMIGTANEGQTFPATGVPFAMTQWTPQTRTGEAKCVPPYYYADTRILGFRASHFLSGSCAQDYGSFAVMPMDHAPTSPQLPSSAFSHESEHATPYLYSVDLADSGIRADVTGTQRSGIMRFRFRPGQRQGFIALENNLRLGTGSVHIDLEGQEIDAENPVYRIYAGAGQPAGFSGYVVVQFDHPFTVGGTWSSQKLRPASTTLSSTEAPNAWVAFQLPPDSTVRVRIGTSFTSLAEARRNVAAEIPGWDLDAVAAQARQQWEHALDAIQVAGASPDRVIFYTALYHAMLVPRIASDSSGTYPRFASPGQVGTAKGFTYYDDYSAWDTFRAVHPLFTILSPDRDQDMVQSIVTKGEDGGYLPIFPAWASYTTEMAGDHTTAIITDAYVKGIRGFDVASAYRLMRKNATQEPADPLLYQDGRGRRALPSYLRYGYVPLEDHVPFAFHPNEQVSRTLDYAYDDFEVGTLASALGHTADAALFFHRAKNYRNVIDPDVGFARGRHQDGTWITPFDPAKPATYITESTPFVDTFFVLQDISGLIHWLHGPQVFVSKLDQLFARGLYDHGNEPSHHIAYLYDLAGVPEKTELHVHELMHSQYQNNPGGLAGNDDAGQMSAWYVFSALGFYPVTPGTPRYEIGTPHFDEMILRAGNGNLLRIHALGAEEGKFYIRSIRLNGKLLSRPYLLHSEIIAGGDLTFEMTDHPSNFVRHL